MKLNHKYASEILVPYCALEDNTNFLLNAHGQYVTTDGVLVEVKRVDCIHALSPKAEELIKSFYGISTVTYLYGWYQRKGDFFSNLELLHIKLEKLND